MSGSFGAIEVVPRRVWSVRWAQGGVCPAVSERYNRGGTAERLHGWQAECYGNGSNRGIDGEKPRSTPKVVPGAAPAMARAGVGGYIQYIAGDGPCTYIHTCMHAYIHTYIHTYTHIHIYIYIYLFIYSWCQNYRTKLGVQKYGKIPYLRAPPDPDSARIRILFYN